ASAMSGRFVTIGEHMSDRVVQAAPTTADIVTNHQTPQGFIRKYVLSLDHKMIGKQYYALALVAVFIGMVLSWLMRIHLVWPNWPIPGLGLLSKVGAPGG